MLLESQKDKLLVLDRNSSRDSRPISVYQVDKSAKPGVSTKVGSQICCFLNKVYQSIDMTGPLIPITRWHNSTLQCITLHPIVLHVLQTVVYIPYLYLLNILFTVIKGAHSV